MKYIVESVSGSFPAQYGKTRVNFTVEGNPNKISGFFQQAPQVGQELEGDIVQKDRFYNFVFPKKESTFSRTPGTPDLNRVEVKLDAIRTDIGLVRGDLADIKGVLGQILQKVGGVVDDTPF